jgi:hypothetical protein
VGNSPADVFREVGQQFGDFSEGGDWRWWWGSIGAEADEGDVFFQRGDSSFSTDEVIWEWVGKWVRPKASVKSGPSSPGRVRVLLQEESLRGGEPPCPFGVLSLCPGAQRLLQHAKGRERLEQLVQG